MVVEAKPLSKAAEVTPPPVQNTKECTETSMSKHTPRGTLDVKRRWHKNDVNAHTTMKT